MLDGEPVDMDFMKDLVIGTWRPWESLSLIRTTALTCNLTLPALIPIAVYSRCSGKGVTAQQALERNIPLACFVSATLVYTLYTLLPGPTDCMIFLPNILL